MILSFSPPSNIEAGKLELNDHQMEEQEISNELQKIKKQKEFKSLIHQRILLESFFIYLIIFCFFCIYLHILTKIKDIDYNIFYCINRIIHQKHQNK